MASGHRREALLENVRTLFETGTTGGLSDGSSGRIPIEGPAPRSAAARFAQKSGSERLGAGAGRGRRDRLDFPLIGPLRRRERVRSRSDGSPIHHQLTRSWVSSDYPVAKRKPRVRTRGRPCDCLVETLLLFGFRRRRVNRLLLFDRVGRITLAAPSRRNREIHLVLPRSGPELPGPALQRNRPDRRPILVSYHLAPSSGVCGPNLRGALTDA